MKELLKIRWFEWLLKLLAAVDLIIGLVTNKDRFIVLACLMVLLAIHGIVSDIRSTIEDHFEEE